MMDVESVLETGGWERGRAIDVSAYERLFTENSFVMTPGVRRVLQEFGGLTFAYPHARSGERKSITLDPVHAIEDFFMEWVPRYSARAGKELLPIGHAFGDYMLLLADADGGIYGGYDDYLVYFGGSIREALENLIKDRKHEEIP